MYKSKLPLQLVALASLWFTVGVFAQSSVEAPATPATTPASTAPTPGPGIENSVVKVFATLRYPDAFKPWTKQAPQEVTGTGVIIEGHRILTNAHVVTYASQVQIQANQSGDKVFATVESIAIGIDLAVLKLDDETFFDSRPPLARSSEVPEIKDAVLAYGYPTGGISLSITKGIVSRIEFAPYIFPVAGLRIQIDAAINPGNSGGPAVVGDKMIGLAFSQLGNAQNIGYIIPNEEIELFLRDVADGQYEGKPALFDDFQTLESSALRSFLKIDKNVEGLVVHRPFETDPVLKEWDVITKIGDTPIDNQGMVKFGPNLRVRFAYLVAKTARDGKLPLTIVREGKEMVVSVPISSKRSMLIPDLEGTYPPYFILGPLAFSKATSAFAGFIGSNAALAVTLGLIRSPLMVRRGDSPSFPGEELVVISSPFFPHKLSKGYASPAGGVVRSINGIPIKNLQHLIEVLRDSTDDYIRIETDSRGGETTVYPRKELIDSTDDILSDNGVRAQGSPDTLAIWNAKKK